MIPQQLIGQTVVVNTDSPYLFTGTLVGEDAETLVIDEVDVRDQRAQKALEDVYLLETLELGVRANRRRVHVLRSRVVSISLLADVVKY
ncbi:MAG: hypothetical protein AB7F75_10085 [Planctomycetota bacterium]